MRNYLEYITGITINQNTGIIYVSSRNGSVHALTLEGNRYSSLLIMLLVLIWLIGELMVFKPKSLRGSFMTGSKKGLQGILYDHESNFILVCNAGSSKIIKLDPTTGIHNILFFNSETNFYF